jgi:hypothetical protein
MRVNDSQEKEYQRELRRATAQAGTLAEGYRAMRAFFLQQLGASELLLNTTLNSPEVVRFLDARDLPFRALYTASERGVKVVACFPAPNFTTDFLQQATKLVAERLSELTRVAEAA